MEKEELQKLDKEELIDIIIEYYNIMKSDAKKHKDEADKIDDDPIENLKWGSCHGYYAALETKANLLYNTILLKMNQKL